MQTDSVLVQPAARQGYRWWILSLGTLTNALVVALQSMCLPVLFKEISLDLNLSLIQIGLLWGISAFPGMFSSLIGGSLGDRFGPRRILVLSCLATGLAGGLRGTAFDFWSLLLTMILFGIVSPIVGNNVFKITGGWMPQKQMGFASGVLSMGMALGFLIGSMLSATVLSPLMGGWRNVLFLYGAVAMILSVPWFFSRQAPQSTPTSAAGDITHSTRRSLAHLLRLQNLWLLGLAIFGIGGAVQGFLGYLPLYLRDLGWLPASADAATAAFHTISLVCVIPIALGSDRLPRRKMVLIPAAILIATGIGLLSAVQGLMIWMAVLMAGMVRDGFMAVFMTTILETKGVGADQTGTAMGMVMVLSTVGSILAPPLGNSLAGYGASLPFLLWSGMALLGLGGLVVLREKK
jgi:MFS family permease